MEREKEGEGKEGRKGGDRRIKEFPLLKDIFVHELMEKGRRGREEGDERREGTGRRERARREGKGKGKRPATLPCHGQN